MFEILDSANQRIVDRTASHASALRTLDWLQARTLRPHHIRLAKDTARTTVR